MKRPFYLLTILLALLALPVDARARSSDPLVGTWVVESFVNTPEGGKPVYPFGKQPVGRFIFTPDGHFSFSVMRGPWRESREEGAHDETTEWVPSWYVSYFGTYSYDPAGPSWTAHVLGGNIPSYIGTDQTRSFTITGNVMTISAVYEDGGKTVKAERVLRKIDH